MTLPGGSDSRETPQGSQRPLAAPGVSRTPDQDGPRDGLEWVAQQLLEHQGHIDIVHLADHGWQVGLSNPGGSLYVQACEGAEKWPSDGGPPLLETVIRAVDAARDEGWW